MTPRLTTAVLFSFCVASCSGRDLPHPAPDDPFPCESSADCPPKSDWKCVHFVCEGEVLVESCPESVCVGGACSVAWRMPLCAAGVDIAELVASM